MKTYAQQQGDFFTAMGSPSLRNGASLEKCVVLAERLIYEEAVLETLPAIRKFAVSPSFENLVEVADGLIDTIYVCLHACHSLGIPADLVWDEVHKSNMAKLGPTGKAVMDEFGKIQKPEGWTPPDIFHVMMEERTREMMGDIYLKKGMVG